MIEQLDSGDPGILAFTFSGKLHDADYQIFVPAVDAAVAAEGKIRLLAHFVDFHGWDMHAAWDDLKFGISHYSAFDRIAIVGDKRWQEWMARFSKPFLDCDVKYFDSSAIDQAWAWVREDR
jgi:hypothetical protein